MGDTPKGVGFAVGPPREFEFADNLRRRESMLMDAGDAGPGVVWTGSANLLAQSGITWNPGVGGTSESGGRFAPAGSWGSDTSAAWVGGVEASAG